MVPTERSRACRNSFVDMLIGIRDGQDHQAGADRGVDEEQQAIVGFEARGDAAAGWHGACRSVLEGEAALCRRAGGADW